MKTLEVRRHSLTKKAAARGQGTHLSREGVRLARLLGDALPPFDYVLTGPGPRHTETAIAMGYAVDDIADWPSGYVPGVVGHHDQWSWTDPFTTYAGLLEQSSELRGVATEHLRRWLDALGQVPDGGAVLVVSSGGSIEPALAQAMHERKHSTWGSALHHLDGATMTFDGNRCTRIRIRRIGDDLARL